MEKYLHLVTVAIDSEGILETISQPLENLHFKGCLAQTLHPTPVICTRIRTAYI